MKLTNKQFEDFKKAFVNNELDILETYTHEDLISTLGEEISDLVVSKTVNWKGIESYLRNCTTIYTTIDRIQEDFGSEYDEILGLE